MNPKVKNVLAVIIGLVAGNILNMAIIMNSGSIIAPPEGVDPMDVESIAANIDLFMPIHFIIPFLAHALGTLLAAFLAIKISASKKMYFSYIVGIFFLIGGIMNSFMIPAPTWFIVVDLVLAYLPMAFIGYKLAK